MFRVLFLLEGEPQVLCGLWQAFPVELALASTTGVACRIDLYLAPSIYFNCSCWRKASPHIASNSMFCGENGVFLHFGHKGQFWSHLNRTPVSAEDCWLTAFIMPYSLKDRIVECRTNTFSVHRFSYLSCRSLHILQSYYESLVCFSNQCFSWPAHQLWWTA